MDARETTLHVTLATQTTYTIEHSYDYSATTTNDYYDDYGMSNGC